METFGAALTVLHVIPPIPVVAVPSEKTLPALAEYKRSLENSIAKNLADLVTSRIPREFTNTPGTIRHEILHGEAAFEIIHYAESHHTDLIVIATHGRTGWEHLVFGSVTEKVVRHSPCPVLTIRPLTASGQG